MPRVPTGLLSKYLTARSALTRPQSEVLQQASFRRLSVARAKVSGPGGLDNCGACLSQFRLLRTSTSMMAECLDSAAADRLVKEFSGLTNSDEAFSMFYLQENGWELQRALNAFFEEKSASAVAKLEQQETEERVVKEEPGVSSIEVGLASGELTTRAPAQLRIISWNIDGLDDKNLKIRTKAVCKIVQQERADIVFLQEVVPATFAYIETKLTNYVCVSAPAHQQNPHCDYFVAILLRKGRVYCDNVKVVEFPNTRMTRNLLCVRAHCGSVVMDLLNTHLESTKEHAAERKAQLAQCFNICRSRPKNVAVVYGGDLNMRDAELEAVGGPPQGFSDVWERCGSRKEVQYTWDLQRNTNLEWAGRFKPRCRFDRVFSRDSELTNMAPEHFGLVGIQKIAGAACFPSDHWGLLMQFRLRQDEQTSNVKKEPLEQSGKRKRSEDD